MKPDQQPKVSVIIPCYNAEEHLARCLESVLAQEQVAPEIICVDDGSSDNTLTLLNDYAAKFPGRIQVVTQKNSGASAARNKGLELATGEYIQFLDADDRLHPGKISHQLKIATANNFPGMIAGAFVRVKASGEEQVRVHSDPWTGLILGRLGCTCSNLFRADAVRSVKGWDRELYSSQEADLMFRMLRNNATVVIDAEELTTVYVRSSGSISSKEPAGNLVRYIRLRSAIHRYLREAGQLTEERNDTLMRIMLGALHMLYRNEPVLAKKIYHQYFKGKFRVKGGEGISLFHALLHRLLGFGASEALLLRIGK